MTMCVAVGDGIGCFGRGVGGNREEGEVRHFGVVTSHVQVASVLWRLLFSFILLCLGQGREMSLPMITYRN